MVLPVRIDHSYESPPWGTLGLVAANVCVFLWASTASAEALVPWILWSNDVRLTALVGSLFLQVGVFHLAGNVVFLLVFGRYVEARIGPWKVVLLYLACGLAGSAAFLLESLAYDAPRGVLGSSGAIAGLMGWTLVAAPRAEIRIFVVWWAHRSGNELPALSAWLVLGGWIAWQLLLWTTAGRYLGTAFSAHFGGLFAGAAIAWWMHSVHAKDTPWFVERAIAGGSMEDARRVRTAEKWKGIGEARRAARARREALHEEAARRAQARAADDDSSPLELRPPAPPEPEHPAAPVPPAPYVDDDDPIEWPLSPPKGDPPSSG